MSVSKLIEEGGEPGRLLTGHLFAVNGGRSFGNAVDVRRGKLHYYVKLLEPYDKPVPVRELWQDTHPQPAGWTNVDNNTAPSHFELSECGLLTGSPMSVHFLGAYKTG